MVIMQFAVQDQIHFFAPLRHHINAFRRLSYCV